MSKTNPQSGSKRKKLGGFHSMRTSWIGTLIVAALAAPWMMRGYQNTPSIQQYEAQETKATALAPRTGFHMPHLYGKAWKALTAAMAAEATLAGAANASITPRRESQTQVEMAEVLTPKQMEKMSPAHIKKVQYHENSKQIIERMNKQLEEEFKRLDLGKQYGPAPEGTTHEFSEKEMRRLQEVTSQLTQQEEKLEKGMNWSWSSPKEEYEWRKKQFGMQEIPGMTAQERQALEKENAKADFTITQTENGLIGLRRYSLSQQQGDCRESCV